MIEFSETAGNVLMVRTDGKITGDQIDAVVADAESMLANYEKIGVVADMTDLEGMTGEAVATDLAAQFKFLGDWKRFPRIAVIAQEGWLKDLYDALGNVLPNIEVQIFAPGQSDQALAFAEGVGAEEIRA